METKITPDITNHDITKEYKEDLKKILNKSPLYLDMSLVEREKFMRYLACIVSR